MLGKAINTLKETYAKGGLTAVLKQMGAWMVKLNPIYWVTKFVVWSFKKIFHWMRKKLAKVPIIGRYFKMPGDEGPTGEDKSIEAKALAEKDRYQRRQAVMGPLYHMDIPDMLEVLRKDEPLKNRVMSMIREIPPRDRNRYEKAIAKQFEIEQAGKMEAAESTTELMESLRKAAERQEAALRGAVVASTTNQVVANTSQVNTNVAGGEGGGPGNGFSSGGNYAYNVMSSNIN
jgi:hypothetical protein